MADGKGKNVEEKKIKVTELKQKQSFTNLDTGEDDEIVVTTLKYSVPDGLSVQDALKQMDAIVHPAEERLNALLKYAESKSYQESKAAALAKGNYLTPQLKSKIVQILQATDAFSEVGARDTYARWYAGYKAKKQSAFKVLERARASEEFADL